MLVYHFGLAFARTGVTVYFTPRIKYPPRVTEGWLNGTEMLIEASKMYSAAG